MSVTAILNIWKRDYLEEQLERLVKQSAPPKETWIIQYENRLNIKDIVARYSKFLAIEYIHSSRNLKYFGRFLLARFVQTEFALILDDDIMPGERWLEHCTLKAKTYNAVIACSGRVIPKGNYEPESNPTPYTFLGDCSDRTFNFLRDDAIADFGVQSYFIKTSWLNSFWKIPPVTFQSGEDMHLAASLKIDLGVRCVVPEQSDISITGNLRKLYGLDQFASWKENDFLETRKQCLQYLIHGQGWKPINW